MASASTQHPDLAREHASSPNFFKSPISTLLKSLDDTSSEVSLHDLIQAYDTFCARIKVLANVLTKDEESFPALDMISENAPQVAQCLRRDIARALASPFPQAPATAGQIPESFASTTPDLLDEDIKYAQDIACVSQHALLLTSSIFRFSSLCNLFDDEPLIDVMTDVISVIKQPGLPTPNEGRTRSLALWILSSQSLPPSVIYKKKREMISTLKKLILEEAGSAVPETILVDALKALSSLLQHHPVISIRTSVQFIPSVLSHLLSRQQLVRFAAAQVLGGFCLSLFHQEVGQYERDCLRDFVLSYVVAQTRRPEQGDNSSNIRRLPDLVGDLINDDQELESCWVLSVVASLLVLSEGAIFFIPSFLRFVFSAIGTMPSSPRHILRVLYPSVWRCLLWSLIAFRRYAERNKEKPDKAVRDWESRWERAVRVVQQEVKDSNGTLLVHYLLSLSFPCDGSDATSNAPTSVGHSPDLWLGVLQDVITHSSLPLHREGITLLARLTSAIGSSSYRSDEREEDGRRTRDPEVDMETILPKGLFDGTILHSDTLVEFATKEFDLSLVRRLTEREVAEHWNTLLDMWVVGLERTLKAGKVPSLSDDLLSIWHALLLIQSDLTQRHGHLEMSQDSTNRAVSALVHIFSPDDTSPPQGAIDQAVIRLKILKQLWTVMKHALSTEWLAQPAGHLLQSIFSAKYTSMIDVEVKETWDEICIGLVGAARPQHLAAIFSPLSELLVESDIKAIWNRLAVKWTSASLHYEWQITSVLLSIPLQHWEVTVAECEIWSPLFIYALSSAAASDTPANIVIDEIMKRVPRSKRYLPLELLLLCFPHVTLGHTDHFPLSLFSHMNDTMTAMYSSQQASVSHISTAFQVLSSIVKTCAATHLLQLFSILTDGVSIWVSDEKTVFTNDDFNENIVPFYRLCLDALKTIPVTSTILLSLEKILCSAFSHMPPPALGPVACSEYWKAINAADTTGKLVCPSTLKTCLLAFHDVCGGEAPVFRVETESQESLALAEDCERLSLSRGTPSRDEDARASQPQETVALSRHPSGQVERILEDKEGLGNRSSPEPLPPSPLPPPSEFEVPSSPSAMDIPSSSPTAQVNTKRPREDDDSDRGILAPPGVSRSSSYAPSSPTDYHLAKRARITRDESGPPDDGSSPEVPLPARLSCHPPLAEPSLISEVSLPRQSLSRSNVANSSIEVFDSEEEYVSWEKALSTPEMKKLKKEITNDGGEEGVETESEAEAEDCTPVQLRSSGLSRSPSITASQMISRGNPEQDLSPLVPSSSLFAKQSTSAAPTHIKLLRDAHKAVKEDASAMPLEEILDAQRLLHEMNGMLNHRLRKRCDSES